MKVSIITVVYNNEKTIADAINSVLSQTYDNIEYIIIDGKSTDDTVRIIEEYGNKIQVFRSEPDAGIYDAMNKGLSYVSGDIVAILNSDDMYADNNVIKEIVNIFIRSDMPDMVYGDLVYVRREDTNRVVRKWISSPYSSNFFDNGNVPPHTSLFIRSHVYQKAGLFKLKYTLAADYEFMFRVFKKFNYRSVYINRLIVKMRLGGATNKSIRNIVRGNIEIIDSWKENGFNAPLKLMPLRIIKRLLQFI